MSNNSPIRRKLELLDTFLETELVYSALKACKIQLPDDAPIQSLITQALAVRVSELTDYYQSQKYKERG